MDSPESNFMGAGGLQWQLALHFFQHLEGSRLSPDTISYNAVTRCSSWKVWTSVLSELLQLMA